MSPATILPADQPENQQLALKLIQQGQLVAFPTDTVYGLGADLHNPQAIHRLYQVKGRDAAKAIAVLVENLDTLDQVVASLPSSAKILAKKFWPGPLTIVLPAHASLPKELSPLPTVGVRMPNHADALALLHLTGPLAVTSANLSGAPSATTAQEVFQQIGSLVPLILDAGKTPGGVSSTVLDLTKEEIVVLRTGPISQEKLEAALQEVRAAHKRGSP